MKKIVFLLMMCALCLTACSEPSVKDSGVPSGTVQERAARDIEPVRPELTTSELTNLTEAEALEIKAALKENCATFRARNNDVSGILRVVGLGIDQPVVSVSDNMEYLRTNVDKEDAFTGVIFFDERIQGDISTVPNVTVYGHNVGEGSTEMFAPLLKMEDQEIFDKVSMMLYQGGTLYVYKPIAAYVTDVSNPYNDPYPAQLTDVLAERPETPSSEISIEEGSKLLTLSTCTNRTGDERFAVQAVLVAKY